VRKHRDASGESDGPRGGPRPIRIRAGLRLGLLLALLGAHLLWPSTTFAQISFAEYQLKVEYLFNFFKFVEFPDELFGDARTPIVIGIVGESPLRPLLEQGAVGRTVHGRDLVIRNYRVGENLRGANILFITASEKKRWPEILAGLKGSNVLTIADVDGFLELGGMIQFVSDNGGARFAINLNATSTTKVKISSKVLTLAHVVGGKAK
jgi:YfiR/HmsC-like